MRKHKSVVAILLAIMMVFTFMPSMAFAYTTGDNPTIDWGDTFQTATSTDKTTGKVTTYDVTYTVDETGKICATASLTVNGVTTPYGTAYFYDMTGATLYRNANNPISGNYEYNAYTALWGVNLWVKLVKPSYVKDAAWPAATSGAAVLSPQERLGNDTNYVVNAKGKADETATKGETKSIEGVVVSSQSAGSYVITPADGSISRPFIVGAPNVASVTITDGSDVATAAGWYLDTVNASTKLADALNGVAFTYDGAEHAILYKAPADQATWIEKFNTSKSVWEKVDGLKLKNAGTFGRYRGAYKDATGTVVYSNANGRNFVVNTSTLDPEFGFNFPEIRTDAVDYELTPEQAANPAKFVELEAKTFVAADADELMNYFNDFYEVKVAKAGSNENNQLWTIEEKYDATKTADAKTINTLNKKYATLLANYGEATLDEDGDFVGTVGGFVASGTRVVKVDTSSELNTKDDDISFSGQTKYVYSGKKTTKKGVLKAKKTIKVKATADSGNAIKYVATKTAGGKITVSSSGKITVKKGLKKGTYKVTVKAKTAAGNGYKAAKEKQTYTIVIKK
jgi:hypothetical protein